MRATAMLLSALAALCPTSFAHAYELSEAEGFSIRLGDVVGTAYYTVETGGYQVIATVSSGDSATPVRFVATLLSGQKVGVSVPRAVGQAPLLVEIKRIENHVFVDETEKTSRIVN